MEGHLHTCTHTHTRTPHATPNTIGNAWWLESDEEVGGALVYMDCIAQSARPLWGRYLLYDLLRVHSIFDHKCCNPLDQLQVGNGLKTGHGRKMAGDMAGSHFSGRAPKYPKHGRANGRIAEIWLFSACPAISQPFFRPFFRHFGPSPKNGRWPFRQPFFGPFQFRAHFPPVAGQVGRNTHAKQPGHREVTCTKPDAEVPPSQTSPTSEIPGTFPAGRSFGGCFFPSLKSQGQATESCVLPTSWAISLEFCRDSHNCWPGQHCQSMHAKRSDPQKHWNFTFSPAKKTP